MWRSNLRAKAPRRYRKGPWCYPSGIGIDASHFRSENLREPRFPVSDEAPQGHEVK